MRGGAPGEERPSFASPEPARGVQAAEPPEVSEPSEALEPVALSQPEMLDRPETPPQREQRPVGDMREPRRDRGPREQRPQREQRPSREPRESRDSREERPRPPMPSITDLLKEGQEIIVQIAKEPLGQKGARITSHVALPGRFLVYMPSVDHIGVSRKIPSDEERLRLKKVLQTHRTGIPGGFIVRTAGEGKSEEELRADMTVPPQPVDGHAAEGREEARAATDASRSGRGAAHPARSAHIRVQNGVGG